VTHRKGCASIATALVLFFGLTQTIGATDITTFSERAIEFDLLRKAADQRESSLIATAESALLLPDPAFRIGMANLPIDSFDFNREPMTQLTLGIKQSLPRRATRELSRDLIRSHAYAAGLEYGLRTAEVLRDSRIDWLSYRALADRIQLITAQKVTLETLHKSSLNLYQNSISARQSSPLRLQADILLLEDRLIELRSKLIAAQERLRYWDPSSQATQWNTLSSEGLEELKKNLQSLADLNLAAVTERLSQHPNSLLSQSKVRSREIETDLARDTYIPQFGIEASYGFRDDSPIGTQRSDFGSIALTFTVPLRQTRQDLKVKAAEAARASSALQHAETEKRLIREVIELQARGQRLIQQFNLIRDHLLPLTQGQIVSLEIETTQNSATLTEVLDAQIRLIEHQIKLNTTEEKLLTTAVQLEFYLTTSTNREVHHAK
jgi:outer membrane protein TolC